MSNLDLNSNSETQAQAKENWGSRFGYVMSMIGMAVGLGAIWRFPMIAAQNGGGTFVLMFVLITACVAIPMGWPEIAVARKAQGGLVKSYEMVLGKKGKTLGFIYSLVPLLLNMYYLIVIGWVLAYTIFSIPGSYFQEPVAFFQEFQGNRIESFLWTIGALLITTVICYSGVKNGIERFCKIALPALFIILIILAVRICMIPGISVGIDYYLKPDISIFTDTRVWLMAGSMAFFALGPGPGYLHTYGGYLKKDQDVTFDFLTVAIYSTFGCVLAGFISVPAVVYFNLDKATGSGLVFSVLPKVFQQLGAPRLMGFAFFLALLGAGISTTISIMEITVNTIVDVFKWERKKTVLVVALVTAIGAIPCVWNDAFLNALDWVVNNIGYTFSAAITAVLFAWRVGANKVREEWMNPDSDLQVGKWFNPVYKYLCCAVAVFFCAQALVTLFSGKAF